MVRALSVAFFLAFLASSSAIADTSPVLEEGINAFQKADWEHAKESFSKLLDDPKWSFAGLYNLGNVAVRQKQLGLALAFYRRAYLVNPHDSDLAFNLSYVTAALGIKRPNNFVDSFFSVVQKVTPNEVLTLFYIISLFFFSQLVRCLRLRQQTENDEGSLHISATLVISILFLILSTAALVVKTYDLSQAHATVIAKTELRSGPGESNASMMDINEGADVLIQNARDGWTQIALPGSLTGWVKENAVMAVNGGDFH